MWESWRERERGGKMVGWLSVYSDVCIGSRGLCYRVAQRTFHEPLCRLSTPTSFGLFCPSYLPKFSVLSFCALVRSAPPTWRGMPCWLAWLHYHFGTWHVASFDCWYKICYQLFMTTWPAFFKVRLSVLDEGKQIHFIVRKNKLYMKNFMIHHYMYNISINL